MPWASRVARGSSVVFFIYSQFCGRAPNLWKPGHLRINFRKAACLIEDRGLKNLTRMLKPLLNAPLPCCQEEARTILWRHRPVRGLVATGFSNGGNIQNNQLFGCESCTLVSLQDKDGDQTLRTLLTQRFNKGGHGCRGLWNKI